WMDQNNLQMEDLLVMGDDVPDLPLMEGAGLAACPDDAIEDIKHNAHYISALKGGQGAARDVIEKVMRLQGTWDCNREIRSIRYDSQHTSRPRRDHPGQPIAPA